MTILAAIPGAILGWPFGHGHSTAGPCKPYGYQGLPKGSVQVGWRNLAIWCVVPAIARLPVLPDQNMWLPFDCA